MTTLIPGDYTPAADAFAGRTVLVTGAGGGLGGSVATGAARCGAEVILLGRTVRRLEATCDRIVEAGGPTPTLYPMDLAGAIPQDYADLADRIENAYGCLHGIVHAAAEFSGLVPLAHLEPGRLAAYRARQPDRAVSDDDRLPVSAPVRAGRRGRLCRRRSRPARPRVLGGVRNVQTCHRGGSRRFSRTKSNPPPHLVSSASTPARCAPRCAAGPFRRSGRNRFPNRTRWPGDSSSPWTPRPRFRTVPAPPSGEVDVKPHPRPRRRPPSRTA